MTTSSKCQVHTTHDYVRACVSLER